MVRSSSVPLTSLTGIAHHQPHSKKDTDFPLSSLGPLYHHYAIATHGCQMNVYDSEKMEGLMETNLHLKPVDDEKEADVLLLNTCSIREKAQEKVFTQLGFWKKLKQKKPHLILGVGGVLPAKKVKTF